MNLTECLPHFLQEIKNPAIAQVEPLLHRIPCTYQHASPYITEPKAPLHYGRNVLFNSDLFEVIVLNLPPHTETPVHDHGESFCCVKVVRGTLHNRIFEVPSSETASILKREEVYATGETFIVTKDQIHSMYNPSDEALICFHIYSPPIRNNTIYTPSNQKV